MKDLASGDALMVLMFAVVWRKQSIAAKQSHHSKEKSHCLISWTHLGLDRAFVHDITAEYLILMNFLATVF